VVQDDEELIAGLAVFARSAAPCRSRINITSSEHAVPQMLGRRARDIFPAMTANNHD
jgi:cyanophycinase-like exopeptidase